MQQPQAAEQDRHFGVVQVQQPIGYCTVLCRSPFQIFNRPDLDQGFFEMIKNTFATQYQLVSITTLLMFVPLLLYLILGIVNGSIMKLPYFAIDTVVLTPFKLQQFEFHRLYTHPMIFPSLNEAVLNTVLVWIIASRTEDVYGWKILIVLIGLPGLVGGCTNLCFQLVGMNAASTIIDWTDIRLDIMMRRGQIIVYFVLALLFGLLLLTQDRFSRITIASAVFYGFMYGFIVPYKNPRQPKTFNRLARFLAILSVVMVSSLLIMQIVFQRKTII